MPREGIIRKDKRLIPHLIHVTLTASEPPSLTTTYKSTSGLFISSLFKIFLYGILLFCLSFLSVSSNEM